MSLPFGQLCAFYFYPLIATRHLFCCWHRNCLIFQVLVRNVPPDPDESVSELVEHFFLVNHPDHYLTHQVWFTWFRDTTIIVFFLIIIYQNHLLDGLWPYLIESTIVLVHVLAMLRRCFQVLGDSYWKCYLQPLALWLLACIYMSILSTQ